MKKKLLISATAFTLLTVGYTSSAFAAKNPNDKDCGQFKNKQEIMEFWHSNGYSATNDPHDLDRDNDGLPCEVNKGEYDQFVASKQAPVQKQTSNSTTKVETKENKKQAEKLPNTASNNVTMMLVSAGLVLLGSIFVFRRKKTNA
ncbi:excalibur calcium-binding domain-containing protein [Bacillus sp. XF8]|uniref:excalibur calcium-binding domain-containing protein n=1 Tax=Bacillus sp. XF8 TaxID=2819289 RepID=UPI001AA03465|nr:excalibur calcium-binding domain-containing protein [Bacillus sp. XF8]MBO1579993.1 excalibur calcium-binding domain-containing protein [Bacillus sp. XF8]